MVRKLFAAAVLVLAVGISATPAPAIDFICRCDLCKSRPNLGCRGSDGRITSCSLWYASHC